MYYSHGGVFKTLLLDHRLSDLTNMFFCFRMLIFFTVVKSNIACGAQYLRGIVSRTSRLRLTALEAGSRSTNVAHLIRDHGECFSTYHWWY
jgi:hypothetical protein